MDINARIERLMIAADIVMTGQYATKNVFQGLWNEWQQLQGLELNSDQSERLVQARKSLNKIGTQFHNLG